MGYLIQLEAYEGPFDLLLDLIAKNEIDIWDIPIAAITEQYLEYLFSLQEQDLAITGEFLVMAATLIRIKSRLLLPPEPVEEEFEEEVDPRLELVEQLLRYKFFKEVSVFLQERYSNAAKVFTRGQMAAQLDMTPIFTDPVGDVTVTDLKNLYSALITEAEKEEPVHSVPSSISLPERMARIRVQMVGQPRVTFQDLLRDSTPEEIVVTFLAILELVRLGEIAVVQHESLGPIDIEPFALEVEVQ
ncbi:MAG: segregation/condensation protein A [Firmicutes bacterium]|nr:segregation/condensation protein A [Bacillota bacterium]